MSKPTFIGVANNIVFGIAETKPIHPPAAGKVRFRMRENQFAFAIVRGADGHCRWACIFDDGETWRLDFNVSPPDGMRELRRQIEIIETENRNLRTILDLSAKQQTPNK